MTVAVAPPARPRGPLVGDPVRDYAEAVVDGAIVAGPLVRLACRRHLFDVKRARRVASGLRWELDEALRVIELFGRLHLPTGEPFALAPSQLFIVGSLFGWELRDGGRRFRTAYVEEGKGNGKTPLAGGVGIVGLVADGEHRAEVYTAGVTRDQAHYLWKDADAMVAQSPWLRRMIERRVANLGVLSTGSYMRPVSSEARSLDQKRVHMALIDEVHEHPDGTVVEKMRAGTKGDDRALIFEITNAGYDRGSICWQHHEYSRAVLEGTVANDSWFAYVAALDEGDDWMVDEGCWVKANPLLDVTVTRRYLREQVQEARDMPAKRNLVGRLNFCEWNEASVGAIDLERWDAGAVAPAIPVGARVFGGLDLGSTTDLTGLVLLHEAADGFLDVECRFWCPESTIEARTRRDHLPYDLWAAQGWIAATPGDVTDYAAILAELTALSERYAIVECGFTRLNATQFVTQADGVLTTMVPISQTTAGMSAATKDWLARIVAGRLRHGANPVLRWMAANLVVDENAQGDMKPSGEHSTERIVGQVAAIAALARLTAPHDPAPGEPSILGLLEGLSTASGGPTPPELDAPASSPPAAAPALERDLDPFRCQGMFRVTGPGGQRFGQCRLAVGHTGDHMP